jgi:translation initiation factor IF-3
VSVPRRFDRRPPERDTTRINERIRVPEVRLIDEQGNQIGVLKTPDALAFAQERDLDLVEVAPEARPPVCRVLDYSKYKYEQAQKVKQARKHQQQITIREIKFRPKIAQHDYDTKKHHVERFLRHKDKVKVTIMFRGREVTHPERGTAILERLAEELAEIGVVEQHPMQEGRNMTMMMAPSKAVLAGRVEVSDVSDEVRDGAHVGDVASIAIDSPSVNGAVTGDQVGADSDQVAAATDRDGQVADAADGAGAAGGQVAAGDGDGDGDGGAEAAGGAVAGGDQAAGATVAGGDSGADSADADSTGGEPAGGGAADGQKDGAGPVVAASRAVAEDGADPAAGTAVS